MKLDHELARRILLEEAAEADQFELTGPWVDTTKALSAACDKSAKTMIAMLGTAMLAKATDTDVDVFSLKVGKDRTGRSYSARALCKEVLAAEASKLGIHLGVTGREPLNNQPFFGKDRITRNMNVHANAAKAFNILFQALSKIEKIRRSEEARLALRSFISVRKVAKPKIRLNLGTLPTREEVSKHLLNFIRQDGENGKRAQAVVAGIMDCLFGAPRVRVSRVNDPSRSYPGDVGIMRDHRSKDVERSFEVRDKSITPADLRNFTGKATEKGLTKIGMVALAKAQPSFDPSGEVLWAARRGVRLGVFFGLDGLLEQALFWSQTDGVLTAQLLESVFQRAAQLEVSDKGLKLLTKFSK